MRLAGRIQRTLTLGAILLLLASVEPAWAAGRIVAVGDIHGEYQGFVAILREAKVIDAQNRWVGGDTTLVQTGDVLDRGKQVRPVLDLLLALEGQASEHGGKVWVLLGNHEVMNLLRMERDANPEAYADFADEKSERRRLSAYEEYLKYRSRRARQQGLRPEELGPEDRARWMADYPPGRLEYQAALGRKGKYGRWLRKRRVAVKLDDVIFMHAGPGPDVNGASLETINKRIRREIADFDRFTAQLVTNGVLLPFFDLDRISTALREEIGIITGGPTGGRTPRSHAAEVRHRKALVGLVNQHEWWSFKPDGPLWFRGFATWNGEEGLARVDELLERYEAQAFVVAHSGAGSGGRIGFRFGGKVLLIDTGMLASHYGNGRPSALEIRDGTFTAIYQGSRVPLEPRQAAPTASEAAAPRSP